MKFLNLLLLFCCVSTICYCTNPSPENFELAGTIWKNKEDKMLQQMTFNRDSTVTLIFSKDSLPFPVITCPYQKLENRIKSNERSKVEYSIRFFDKKTGSDIFGSSEQTIYTLVNIEVTNESYVCAVECLYDYTIKQQQQNVIKKNTMTGSFYLK